MSFRSLTVTARFSQTRQTMCVCTLVGAVGKRTLAIFTFALPVVVLTPREHGGAPSGHTLLAQVVRAASSEHSLRKKIVFTAKLSEFP